MMTIRTQHNHHRFSTIGIKFIKAYDNDVLIQYEHVKVVLECHDNTEVVKVLRTIDDYIQRDIIK